MTGPVQYRPGVRGWVLRVIYSEGYTGARTWIGPDLYQQDGPVPGMHPPDTAWVWPTRRAAEAFIRPFMPERTSMVRAGYLPQRVAEVEAELAVDPYGGPADHVTRRLRQRRCGQVRTLGALGATTRCDYIHDVDDVCPNADNHVQPAPPQEYEQTCERCGGPFEAAEETSLCPQCEAKP